MRNSSGFTLAEGGANDSVILYYYGGQLVSPGCKHTRSGGGSAYTSCWAWY
jgi:hypothetical protein